MFQKEEIAMRRRTGGDNHRAVAEELKSSAAVFML